ncbi:MAG TPA: hypothetical protein ENJ95_24295 [Bacteroidetes bacterium]|nr:hypothetical protein [Bacteroidota bacterium]
MKKLGEFLFYEGPLVSHFISNKKEDYIMKWCDHDNEVNRWMLYKTNHELLHRFFNKQIGARQLILKTPDQFVHFIDIDNNIDWKRVIKVELNNLSEKNLPKPDAYYEKGDFEPYGEKLRMSLNEHFSRPIKSYKAPEATIEIVAEPPPKSYKKKKKGKG